MNTVLSTHNLSIGYRVGNNRKTIVPDINIALCEGELVCLLGANGKGKSTLLRTLAGSQTPLSGRVEIGGVDVTSFSKKDLAQKLSLVYTDHTQAGGLTVRELVQLGRYPHTGFLGRLGRNDSIVVESAIADVGILSKIDDFIAELSDGERQKAMIAKALAQSTPIILLDEPTAFLDIASKIGTMRLLHNLARKNNKVILLSTHDVSQALLFADKLIVIDAKGRLHCGVTEDMVLAGTLTTLFDSEDIKFDAGDGNFKTCDAYVASAIVKSPVKSVKYWIENALRRNGIASTSDESSADIIVEAATAMEIVCTDRSGHGTAYDSIGDMINGILNLIK